MKHAHSSLIQTILSVLELHQINRPFAARGLYRRWGLAPRPEDIVSSCLKALYDRPAENATPNFRGWANCGQFEKL